MCIRDSNRKGERKLKKTYLSRMPQKVYVNQFPVLTPDQIPSTMQWQIVKRVAELCYFNHDMDGWAEELWEEMSEEQRAELPQ